MTVVLFKIKNKKVFEMRSGTNSFFCKLAQGSLENLLNLQI